MKRLLFMLLITLGVVASTQAQGVVDVQEEGVRVEAFNPFNIEQDLNEVFANADFTITKIVSFEFERSPELDSVIVTTNVIEIAEVLENEIGVRDKVVSKNGLIQYTLKHNIDNQILKERLLLASVNKSISTHRVRYLS